MIKASEGGGGKGIRKVTDPANLESSFRQVQAEIRGSPIFLMQLAPQVRPPPTPMLDGMTSPLPIARFSRLLTYAQARHLEVQLLADEYGQAISLSGRDCSVQRRHQKIMEEGPVLAAPPDVWDRMERAAVRLAKEVGCVPLSLPALWPAPTRVLTPSALPLVTPCVIGQLRQRWHSRVPVPPGHQRIRVPGAEPAAASGAPSDGDDHRRQPAGVPVPGVHGHPAAPHPRHPALVRPQRVRQLRDRL